MVAVFSVVIVCIIIISIVFNNRVLSDLNKLKEEIKNTHTETNEIKSETKEPKSDIEEQDYISNVFTLVDDILSGKKDIDDEE